jgi:hypothetical protein
VEVSPSWAESAIQRKIGSFLSVGFINNFLSIYKCSSWLKNIQKILNDLCMMLAFTFSQSLSEFFFSKSLGIPL